MSNIDNTRPPKKVLFLAMIAMTCAIFGSVGVLYYIGMFSGTTVQRYQAPSYRLAYLSHTGPYNEINDVFKQVAEKLEDAGISSTTACAIFLDDASTTAKNALRSKVGYLVSHSDYIPGGLLTEEIPAQEVILGRFDGSPIIGSQKVYPALNSWARENGYRLNLPAMEIYYKNGVIDYQMPITPMQ